jgi:cytidine deaminase
MKEQKFEFSYQVYTDANELPEDLLVLMTEARETTGQAYAPYSRFKVGAIARLANGEKVTGTNQENASFTLGLCAERVLLAAASSIFPKEPIDTIAISYQSDTLTSDHPVSPCGLCRQSLQESETRGGKPIRLVLGGMDGPVYVIESASKLLPLAFTSIDLT